MRQYTKTPLVQITARRTFVAKFLSGPLETNSTDNWIKTQQFPCRKINFKIVSENGGLDILILLIPKQETGDIVDQIWNKYIEFWKRYNVDKTPRKYLCVFQCMNTEVCLC